MFNDEWLANPVKIRLEIESPVDQDIVISANGDHAAALREGSYWYEITTTDPAAEYFLSTKSADIQILDYEIMAITE